MGKRGRPNSIETRVYRIPDAVWDNQNFKQQLFRVWAREAVRHSRGDWHKEIERTATRVGISPDTCWQYLDKDTLIAAIQRERQKLTNHLMEMMARPLFIDLPAPTWVSDDVWDDRSNEDASSRPRVAERLPPRRRKRDE